MGCVVASSAAAPGEDRMAAPLNSQNMELCVLVVAVELWKKISRLAWFHLTFQENKRLKGLYSHLRIESHTQLIMITFHLNIIYLKNKQTYYQVFFIKLVKPYKILKVHISIISNCKKKKKLIIFSLHKLYLSKIIEPMAFSVHKYLQCYFWGHNYIGYGQPKTKNIEA